MPNKNDRVIIDTNLWISFLLINDFSKLERILSDKLITLIFSDTLSNEFIEVAQRDKFKKYFTKIDLENLILRLREVGEFIDVVSTIAICRDAKDDFLLALAKDGKATHLITGDKDLLDIKIFGRTKIITITNYLLNK